MENIIDNKVELTEKSKEETSKSENDEPSKSDSMVSVKTSQPNKTSVPEKPSSPASPNPPKVSTGGFLVSFMKKLEQQYPFFATYTDDSLRLFSYIDSLRFHPDRDTYIKEKKLNTLIADQADSIRLFRSACDSLIDNFIVANYKQKVLEDESSCRETARNIVNQKLMQREKDVKTLSDALNNIFPEEKFDLSHIDTKTIINSTIVLVVIGLIVFWLAKTKKRKNKQTAKKKEQFTTVSPQDAASQIVVRRKTTSILRKQSLEDVLDNPAYMQIDTKDFCKDSAVRRIYIKNTCIKGIYNMYADDLRNPNHPNEDGCLVLGRWTYDKEADEYYVSLEEIVYPGDDAVFTEYELNFGAKIKLKANEMLRRLRKDTDKQYDLTCWVHSHPGLGVFFSNYDANVQMQHKHPTHPHFLTAIVIDILTPDQELGFFTFRKDGTITSRDDLKKMYSLDQFYKWAVESERNTFNREDYRNILAKTAKQTEDCHGIHLNSEGIDDIRRLKDENGDGFKAKVYGVSIKRGKNAELLVKKVSEGSDSNGTEQMGCLLVSNNYSIPTIRRAVAEELPKIKFVLVYTISDDILTAIPVVDRELQTDVDYNGEEQFQNLIEWTRRKR